MLTSRWSFRTRLTLWFLLIFALLYVALIGGEMMVFAHTIRADDSVPDEFIRTTALLLAIAVPLGLTAAGVAGFVLAGRVVAPLRQITETATHVGPDSLNERVAVESDSPEVAHLQRELNDALERIEHGYRAQQRFIGNVSHELRTPIAVMMSQAQVLQSRNGSFAEYRQFTDEVVYEMRQLGRMIDSFLMLTRSDHNGRLERTSKLSVFDVILDAVEHCMPFAEFHGVRLLPTLVETDNDCIVEGDADLLRTMLDNLIRNAVRHSPRNTVTTIDTSCDDHTITLLVRDQGNGISDDSMPYLFDRFFHAPSGSARTQGTGIGLAIVKSVVTLHGGEIRAYNADDGGACFEVKLPLWSDCSDEKQPAAASVEEEEE